MKIRKMIERGLATATIMLISLSAMHTKAQLMITNVSVTQEGAIRLQWQSESNMVYRIEYADQLVNPDSGGSTLWQTLYDDYASHGASTFWLDTGNYYQTPPIPHPTKSPTRFYRIVSEGTNSGPAPAVTITSPASGFVANGSLTVSVSAVTDQRTIYTLLYVDGQQMPMSNDGTNFVINTCEWPNGPHVLFAVARCASDLEGIPNTDNVLVGHGVSAYVPVLFSNLVTRIAFSEPFFDPTVGQTQQVSAVFAANADWTLQIQDVNSNAVRTVTGSGTSMQFNWDGKADGGADLPAGVYYYYVSAQTNGRAMLLQSPSGDGATASLSSSTSTDLSTQDWTADGWYPTSRSQALAAGWDCYYLRTPPMPPVWTNGVLVPWEEIHGPHPLIRVLLPLSLSAAAMATDGVSPADASANSYSGSGSQPAPAAPQRPPTAPARGVAGTCGVAVQTYTPNGCSLQGPDANYPFGLKRYVQIMNANANAYTRYGITSVAWSEADVFVDNMRRGGWNPTLYRRDDQFTAADIRANGANIFNTVNLGLLLTHGAYGTSLDYTKNYDGTGNQNGCYQIYFPISNTTNGAQYVRMCEFSFGSPGAGGLKWMALSACYSLHQNEWQSMMRAGIRPFNSNLRLLLGVNSFGQADATLAGSWARKMLGTDAKGVAPATIRAAWYAAATEAYNRPSLQPPITDPIYFAVAGDNACMDDTLSSTNALAGSWTYHTQQVH